MGTILRKWGHSVGVRIPALYVKKLNLVPGADVEFEVHQKGLLITPAAKRRRPDLAKLCARFTADNRGAAYDWGHPVGKEAL